MQLLKLFFKGFLKKKNAWTSDLKWCNKVVCPAERNLQGWEDYSGNVIGYRLLVTLFKCNK